MISNDVACIIYNYFNCYNLLFDQYDFFRRLLYFVDIKNGYDAKTSDCALMILESIAECSDIEISRLLVSEYDILNEARKIMKYAPNTVVKFRFLSNLAHNIREIYDSDLMNIMVSTAVQIMREADNDRLLKKIL